MTEKRVRVAVILDNEVIESWEMDDWALDEPALCTVFMSELKNIIRYCKESIDDRS